VIGDCVCTVVGFEKNWIKQVHDPTGVLVGGSRESQTHRSLSEAVRRTLCAQVELMPQGKDLGLNRSPSSKSLPN
jgi:hypothetical protein